MTSALFVTTVPITLEAFLVPFARHFRAQGWRVDALANGAASHEGIAEEFDERFDVAWSRNAFSPANLLGTSDAVRRIVAARDYDIVHVHTPIAAWVTRFALRDRAAGERPVVVYTAHGFHFYQGQEPLSHAVWRTMERTAGPWTDYLVTINREDFSAARALGTIDPERVRYIPGIGVDTERFAPGVVSAKTAEAVRKGLHVGDGDFMLTMIAEFGPVKRHEHLLRAFAQVRDPHAVLVLVGDGPLKSVLAEKVRALCLTDRVRWAGYRRDIPAVLAASDALVLCSEREGLNRSVLEAMAAGVPVIGTDTRGIADAITPETGWVADKRDIGSLATAIRAAASDPEECARRGAAGRKRAKAEYALPRIVDAYEELYREALR
jgi:glycosyltransferase involved in cell wall biosynthesis